MAECGAVNADVEGSTPSEPAKDQHSELLGMPVATATARLKKRVYLDLLRRLGEDICYRCQKPIVDAEDLSLDHKEPWRFDSADLFWDPNNIAHSHRRCNKVDRPRRRVGAPGTSWCSMHKAFCASSAFGPGKRWNGLDAICRSCHASRQAKYAQSNPRFPCPKCRYQMRKKCHRCGYELPMADYMSLRRSEGVKY